MPSAAETRPEENPWENIEGPTNGSNLISKVHRESYEAISPTRPELSQAGRTVLVAGASTGIGFSIAESFAAASATRLIITGRRQDTLDKAAEKVKTKYPNAEVIPINNDFANENATREFWKKLAEDGVFVDVLVLSAAKMWLPNTILGLGYDTFKDGLGVNLIAPYLWTSLFYKQREIDSSRKLVLLNLSSIAIHLTQLSVPIPLYSITKSAGTMMMQHIAMTVPSSEMQVISFEPGLHYTESFERFTDENSFKWDDIKLPGDFAVWAASEEAEFLHGRFIWAKWDVDELKTGPLRKKIESDSSLFRVGVSGY
ncbi:short-chain alcohol dehydrogenase/reductase [Fusarium pseudocircinatum]|uniref:Short-chain alcohol dehydrogenase/reductase n=1 Tax=Fusarium pseudocircinatum TaxID=56676 RepID=A0A8H5KP76_9HYPO|nr:short-chain alcohol dehydrogenase/reductase [Fusarium pseudocircinatum]